MELYLAFGLGLYIGASFYNQESFKDAPISGIVGGFLISMLLWPLLILGMVLSFVKIKK
jgi:RsiW-degrading membrane proteinase PrsW (M82 family)